MEERRPYKAKVAGSRPAAPTRAAAITGSSGTRVTNAREFSEIRVAALGAGRIVNRRERDLLLTFDAAANMLAAAKPKGDS